MLTSCVKRKVSKTYIAQFFDRGDIYGPFSRGADMRLMLAAALIFAPRLVMAEPVAEFNVEGISSCQDMQRAHPGTVDAYIAGAFSALNSAASELKKAEPLAAYRSDVGAKVGIDGVRAAMLLECKKHPKQSILSAVIAAWFSLKESGL